MREKRPKGEERQRNNKRGTAGHGRWGKKDGHGKETERCSGEGGHRLGLRLRTPYLPAPDTQGAHCESPAPGAIDGQTFLDASRLGKAGSSGPRLLQHPHPPLHPHQVLVVEAQEVPLQAPSPASRLLLLPPL